MHPMTLENVKRSWDALAGTDPLWAVLTDPAKKGGVWRLEDFFDSGRVEIDLVMARAQQLGRPARHARALDFGCGVGRLTQALCCHFERCDGVDIAQPMIDKARHHNAFGERCSFHVNHRPDLALFGDAEFDLVYSNIVLQHVPPREARAYVREFVRVLRPGGLLVFQVPDRMRFPRGLARPLTRVAARIYARWRRMPLMEMNGIRRRTVQWLIERAGGVVLTVEDDASAGRAWIGHRWWVGR